MMKKILRVFLFLVLASSQSYANDCAAISDSNSIYKSIIQSTASNLSIKRLQQIVGVNADGIWGIRSDTAYKNLISRCNSYSYPGLTINVDGAKITDFYKNQTVFEQIPYQNCSIQKVPIFGKIQSKPDAGAVVGGAVLGGIIGKAITKKDKGAAVGAIVGGVLANENQKTKSSTGVIGYENRQKCQTEFKNSPKEEVVYSFSTITFIIDGKEQTVEFQKSP
ncbi:MAG: glycine zipper family protein [Paracoccaceae bacterium]